MPRSDFAENLMLLCGYYPSISEVCRRIGINRQQFNKYLAGQTWPSRHNLQRICDFFGVEPSEITMAHPRFKDLVSLRPRRERPSPAGQPFWLTHIEALRQQSGNALDPYQGYYFRYFHSYGFTGYIVKSLVGLFRKDGVYYSKNLGVLRHEKVGRRHTLRFKYLGLPLLINDKIFLIEYESVLHDMVAETILYTSYRNRVDLLAGIQCTVAGTRGREPSAGKVVFEYLGRRLEVRRALAACGLFPHDSDEIDPAIRQRIRNEIPEGRFVLSVSEP